MNNQKVVIVTGGNKGIGLGITKSFVDAGYHVYIGAREEIEIDLINRLEKKMERK